MERQEELSDQIGIRIDPDLRAALERLASADRRTLSNYIRVILENHVAKKEAA